MASSSCPVSYLLLQRELHLQECPTSCIGYACSKGRRCGNKIARENGHDAANRLYRQSAPSIERLTMVARLCLCTRHGHVDQAPTIVARWMDELEDQQKAQGVDTTTKESIADATAAKNMYSTPISASSSSSLSSCSSSNVASPSQLELELQDKVTMLQSQLDAAQKASAIHKAQGEHLQAERTRLHIRQGTTETRLRNDLSIASASEAQMRSQLADAVRKNKELVRELDHEKKHSAALQKRAQVSQDESKAIREENSCLEQEKKQLVILVATLEKKAEIHRRRSNRAYQAELEELDKDIDQVKVEVGVKEEDEEEEKEEKDKGEPAPTAQVRPKSVFEFATPTSQPKGVFGFVTPTSQPKGVFRFSQINVDKGAKRAPAATPTAQPKPVFEFGQPKRPFEFLSTQPKPPFSPAESQKGTR